jgi:membrane-associated phospholipid phosphatase
MLTQVTKYIVRRDRPSPSTCHPGRAREPDRNLSFFSGHSAVVFALVSSAHETARLRGRPTSNWIWVGGAAAVTTGYLRVAADRHHLIDVLAGAGVGYLVGRWVPRHLHHPSSPRPGAASELQFSAGQNRMGPPLIGYTKSMMSGNRRVLVRLGSGPGRGLQLGVSF